MEELGGGGIGVWAPHFFDRGVQAPHIAVENRGIIKKKLIYSAAGFGPSGCVMDAPLPTSNHIPPSMDKTGLMVKIKVYV